MQPSPLKCLMSLFYDVIIQITAWFLLTPILLLIINDSHQFKTLIYQISFWLISGVYFIFSWFYETSGEKNFVFFSDEIQEGPITDEFKWNDAHLELNEDYFK